MKIAATREENERYIVDNCPHCQSKHIHSTVQSVKTRWCFCTGKIYILDILMDTKEAIIPEEQIIDRQMIGDKKSGIFTVDTWHTREQGATISQLIKKLEEIAEQEGDLPVYIADYSVTHFYLSSIKVKPEERNEFYDAPKRVEFVLN